MQIETGFVLTRQVRDLYINQRKQCQIELWLTSDNGPLQLLINDSDEVFFIAQQDNPQASHLISQHASQLSHPNSTRLESLMLHTFEQQKVCACYCHNQTDSRFILQLFKQHDIVTYEDDIRLADRYLMERFIKGGVQFTGQFHAKTGYQQVTQTKCKAADYQPRFKVVSLDIECSEKGILYSIGLDSPMDSRVIMVGKAQPHDNELNIEWVADEIALLKALIVWFNQYDPDVIIGWNVIDFDFQLLDKRAQWHKLPLTIGRGQQALYVRQSNQNQQSYISLAGRVVLDGINSLKTATYHFPSWSLESVAQQLLGQGKAMDSSHDRMAEINDMYRHNKPHLARYNLQDCKLVNQIFDHCHLLPFLIERTRLTGIELDRLGGSVASFTNLYLPQLHRAGYIAPNLHPENWQASPGGYVMDSDPGLYDSVLVLDFKSLYPSIIRTFLIDPLGLIEGLKLELGTQPHQAVEGFKGAQFHRHKHFLPQMIEQLWQARDAAKRSNEQAFSQAIKIIMNSFYGVLGSSGCRFFDTRLASSITMRGHEIMKQTRILIEQQGYQVIYGDTDSLFVSLRQLHSQTDADKIGQQLAADINAWWQQHVADNYALTSALELEFETHYKKFLMPTIRGSAVDADKRGSKKRYCGMIERDGKEQLIFKGLESVRTDWTPLSHHFQQQLYALIFHNQDPQALIRQYAADTLAGKYDSDLVYQKRLRRRLSDYQKNIPPQVRAARLADQHNARLNRPLQYQNRGRIEYLLTINGPEPKDYLSSPIDYQHYIDKQLKPVANAILPFIGLDFDTILAPQLGLF